MKPNNFNGELPPLLDFNTQLPWEHIGEARPRPEHVEAEPFDKFGAEIEALRYKMRMQQVIATPRLSVEQLRFRPVDMILHCPKCGKLHIDKPDPFAVELRDVPDLGMTAPEDCAERIAAMTEHDAKRWTNPPHKTHLCRIDQGGCGNEWQPFDYPTNGVAPE